MGLIIKNVDTIDVAIDDLGITLVPNEEYDLSQDRSNKIATSADLPAAITAGEINVLDPLNDITPLTSAQALEAVAAMNDTHYRIRGGELNQLEDVAISNPTTDDTLKYNGTNFVNVPMPVASASSFQLEWRYSNSIVAGDPGSGNFTYNTLTLASVTRISFSDVSNSGVDVSTIVLELEAGDHLYVQQNDTAANAVLFEVTSVTDQVGYTDVGVTVVDSGTIHTNTSKCATSFFFIAPITADRIVQVTTNDTNADFLDNSISTSTGLTTSVTNPGGDEVLNIAPANDLGAVEGLTTTGIAVRTGAETWDTRTIQGTTDQITVTDGDGVAANPIIAIAANPVISGTESLAIPSGTTAERPTTPIIGDMRFNTDLGLYEAWDGTQWLRFGAEAGSGVTEIISGQLAQLSGTSTTPYDNTPPLVTEGSPFFTQVMTTQTDTGRVVIWFSTIVTVSNANRVATIALYRDTTLVGVTAVSAPGSNQPQTATFIVADAPGAAGTYTYTGRIGISGGGTWYTGGWTSNANYGGAANTNNQYVLMRIE